MNSIGTCDRRLFANTILVPAQQYNFDFASAHR